MTHYDRGVLPYGTNKPRRTIAYISSPDGITWSAWQDIATIEEGHYQSSGQRGSLWRIIGSFKAVTQNSVRNHAYPRRP